MVEFHRFGGERTKLLSPENEYIRTGGYDEPASAVRPCVDQERSLDLLYQLRYLSGITPDEVQGAPAELGRYATAFLPSLPSSGERLVQIDLVTNAAELWAFPFEACYSANASWLASADRGVIFTRRIRGGFSDDTLPWPDQPQVARTRGRAVTNKAGQNPIKRYRCGRWRRLHQEDYCQALGKPPTAKYESNQTGIWPDT